MPPIEDAYTLVGIPKCLEQKDLNTWNKLPVPPEKVCPYAPQIVSVTPKHVTAPDSF